MDCWDLTTRTWSAVSEPIDDLSRLVRRYQAAWWDTGRERPDVAEFLPPGSGDESETLVALLRADMGLKRWSGEPARAEDYFRRFDGLDDEARAALVYEEFCLREEAGESPHLDEYVARFPDLADRIRRVLAIHSLVCSARSQTAPDEGGPAPEFPEVGQTIAGFRLIEELGRGAFARVYRAEERQLSDRSVALKLSRASARESQTLARLQHTHIVPVYSFRTDPATGLHLLCMPYFGRVTLADLFRAMKSVPPRTGGELLDLVRRIARDPNANRAEGVGQAELAGRSYPRAIALWGARLAEALQHAHDRGVLHRDIKPSNVLVTDDGMPMLLDFNLAREPLLDDIAALPAKLGGTLMYMAPEHLDAVALGQDDRVDARADIYALGLVLFEAMGSRPFPQPGDARTIGEALARSAANRRAGAPSARDRHPATPPALDAVLRKCLAPEPSERYARAADLAADLQAIADDRPLLHAREPLPSAAVRWARSNRRRLAVALPFAAALAAGAALWVQGQRLRGQVEARMADGREQWARGRFELAAESFGAAAKLAGGSVGLRELAGESGRLAREAASVAEVRDRADAFFQVAESLRFRLHGVDGDRGAAVAGLLDAFRPFHVLDSPDWWHAPDLARLDTPRRESLRREVDELLFLAVVAADSPADPQAARRAVAFTERALAFTRSPEPWRALRARHEVRSRGQRPAAPQLPPPSSVDDPLACFQWSLLAGLAGQRDAAETFLEKAVRLEPDRYWSQFTLADWYHRDGRIDPALAHYDVAVALAPHLPWARFNRAHLYWADRQLWDLARDELDAALAVAGSGRFAGIIHLEQGILRRRMGDHAAARALFESLARDDRESRLARLARLNLAALDADDGAIGRARTTYELLLDDDPADEPARRGRALLAIREGRLDSAEADLSVLIGRHPGQSDLLVQRALVRLRSGRRAEAAADAALAAERESWPSRRRLLDRCRLAAGADLLELDRPDEIDRWPVRGRALRHDLRAAAERLLALAGAGDEGAAAAWQARAVVLGALGKHRAALKAIDWALRLEPGATRPQLIRARLLRHAGDRDAALSAVEQALGHDPGHPGLLELRGELHAEAGRTAAALADLKRAGRDGDGPLPCLSLARAWHAARRYDAAVTECTRVLRRDPDDARAYLLRASSFARLGRTWEALADVEQAVDHAGRDPACLARSAVIVATCLPARPERLPRVLSLARAAVASILDGRE